MKEPVFEKGYPSYKSVNAEEGFEYEGIWITDPYLSECGRFEVNPKEYYGVDV